MENYSEETQNKQHTNIELIYDYTKDWLKLVNDSINNLNTKLGSLLAFSGIAVGFSINLPNEAFLVNDSTKQYFCYSCLILKILVCLCLIVAIFASTSVFLPKAGGGMTPPDLLMKENYYDSDEDIRLIITKTSIEALAELESLRDNKAKFVSSAILALGSAAFFAATDVIWASILSII